MENTANPVPTAPVGQLKTNKGLLKTILLSIITFGIYGIVVMSSVSNDINVVASRYDRKKTMHYCLLVFLVGPLTLGIGYIVWNHKLCNRIGAELRRQGLLALERAGCADPCGSLRVPAQALQRRQPDECRL